MSGPTLTLTYALIDLPGPCYVAAYVVLVCIATGVPFGHVAGDAHRGALRDAGRGASDTDKDC